jgi:hypothetical protein
MDKHCEIDGANVELHLVKEDTLVSLTICLDELREIVRNFSQNTHTNGTTETCKTGVLSIRLMDEFLSKVLTVVPFSWQSTLTYHFMATTASLICS